MRAAAFDYCAPRRLGEAIDLLQRSPVTACLIAGGQSLVPEMASRAVVPELVVDLRRLGLDQVVSEPVLRIGAMVRQAELERSAVVRNHAPLLAEAASLIGYRATRSRGTIGGSAAHADPRAEIPVALVTLDATVDLEGPQGRRAARAAEYFRADPTRRRGHSEVIVGFTIPEGDPWRGHAFLEQAPRHRGFAVASAAVVMHNDADGIVTRARATLGAVDDRPVALTQVAEALVGHHVTAPLGPSLVAAIDLAVDALQPPSDFHATSGHRRELAGEMLRRAIVLAARRAEDHLD